MTADQPVGAFDQGVREAREWKNAQIETLMRERDALRGVCQALDEFQRRFGTETWDPDGMPGNDLYRRQLQEIVKRARSALAA